MPDGNAHKQVTIYLHSFSPNGKNQLGWVTSLVRDWDFIYSVSYLHDYFCFYVKQVLFLCGKNWEKTRTVPRWRLLETWDRCSWNRWAFFLSFPGQVSKLFYSVTRYLLEHLLSFCEWSIRLRSNNFHSSRSFASCFTSFRLVQCRSLRSTLTVLLHWENLRSAALLQSILKRNFAMNLLVLKNC